MLTPWAWTDGDDRHRLRQEHFLHGAKIWGLERERAERDYDHFLWTGIIPFYAMDAYRKEATE